MGTLDFFWCKLSDPEVSNWTFWGNLMVQLSWLDSNCFGKKNI